MAGLGGIFGEGTTANQLLVWGVLNQVLSTLMAPFMTELANVENSAFPNVPLPADVAAAAVARRHMSLADGQAEARKSGFDHDVFATMVAEARRVPDVSSVFELYRRNLIDPGSTSDDGPSLNGALGRMGYEPEWLPLLEKLSTQVPTVAEIMNAWLEGQITEGEARRRYTIAGGDPSWFRTAYDTNGQAPTPVQALELWNRGIIPEGGTGPGAVSYEQAFLEGPWRNKWLPAFKALRRYLPPPRTVTAMYREGTIDREYAAELLAKQGLTQRDIGYYLKPKAKAATDHERHLTKADVLGMYSEHILSRDDAVTALRKLDYTAHDAAELVSLQTVRMKARDTRSAVSRIRTLYLANKIADTDALSTLEQLGIKGAEARQTLQLWRLQTAETVRELSAAQIESAVYYEFLTTNQGLARLRAMGYSAHDAWLALSVRLKAKAGPEPSPNT